MLLLLMNTMTTFIVDLGVYFQLVEDMIWQSHVSTVSRLKLRWKLHSHIINWKMQRM